MGNFIKQPSFSRYFYPHEDFGIFNVGYDDFSFVKPATVFRTQGCYTWHFVISGNGTLEIFDNKYEINAGEMFFIPPNNKMRYFPSEKTPWEYVWFSFHGDLTKQYSEQAGFSAENLICKIENFEKVKTTLKKMLDSQINGEGGYFGVLSAFYEIMEILCVSAPLTNIQHVKKLLDENFTVPTFSINQLCYDVGISHAHLLRLFKEAYGITLIKYMTKKRIELACDLLRTTDLSVSSVAYSSGFSDEIHFMKIFKKTIGMSALHYKKQSRNEFQA